LGAGDVLINSGLIHFLHKMMKTAAALLE